MDEHLSAENLGLKLIVRKSDNCARYGSMRWLRTCRFSGSFCIRLTERRMSAIQIDPAAEVCTGTTSLVGISYGLPDSGRLRDSRRVSNRSLVRAVGLGRHTAHLRLGRHWLRRRQKSCWSVGLLTV